jgi:hypothetical protein
MSCESIDSTCFVHPLVIGRIVLVGNFGARICSGKMKTSGNNRNHVLIVEYGGMVTVSTENKALGIYPSTSY